MNSLVEKIKKSVDDSLENTSILIKEIGTGNVLYKFCSDKKLVSASTIKVPIMLAVLDEVCKKKIDLNTKILVNELDILADTEVFENNGGYYSLFELVSWMIISSDNTATNVLLKYFGIDKINNYIRNVLEVENTYIERYMLDETAVKNGFNNYMTQNDMFRIFELLFQKVILNEELCNLAIEILKNQRCQNQLMRYICIPINFAHKTGVLDYLNHDVGVVCINNRMFYIGVSVYESKNIEGNKQLVGNIGRLVYEYLKELNNFSVKKNTLKKHILISRKFMKITIADSTRDF